MAKRNYEWPAASVFDGFFTQDKLGGVTEAVAPSVLFAALVAAGFFKNAGDALQFALSYTPPDHVAGRVYWSQVSQCLRVQSSFSDSELEVGEENWVRFLNDTGSTITAGTVISIQGGIAGGTDTVAKIVLANPGSKMTATATHVVTTDVANGAEGLATKYGKVRGINTSGLSVGPVYLDPATPGGVTNTEPPFPSYSARVGVVMTVSATDGILFVDPDTDPQFQGGLGVAAGGETFNLLKANQNYGLSLGSSTWGYFSSLFIPKTPITVSQMSCFILQVGTFVSMRMGIYSRGSTDVLLGQTALATSVSLGVNTLSMESPLILSPNTAYMLAMQVSANGTQLAFDQNTTLNPNIPNHFGRSDFNPGDPSGGMVTPVSYSISTDHPWIGVS